MNVKLILPTFSSFSLRQPLIHLEEAGDAIGFGETFDGETVGGHNGAVVVLMGSTQFGGHSHFVVEVSQGTVVRNSSQYTPLAF